MEFVASLHAYEFLGDVVWNLVVLEYDDYTKEKVGEALRRSGKLPDVGHDEAEPWVAALIDDISHSL